MVATLDGAVAGADGLSGSISSPADRAVFPVLRGLADVVLVGAGTVAAERYADPEPKERFAEARAALGQAPAPALAVVTASGRLPDRLLAGPGRLARTGRWRLVVLTTASAGTDRLAALRDRLGDDAVVVAGDVTVDPTRALAELVSRGLPRVLCEGGPTLLAAVVAAGCLDELCLTTSPLLAGGPSGRLLRGAPVGASLDLGHLLEQDGTLMARWVARRA
jgi:riboflavin biosynthesis pyrimidine reductase